MLTRILKKVWNGYVAALAVYSSYSSATRLKLSNVGNYDVFSPGMEIDSRLLVCLSSSTNSYPGKAYSLLGVSEDDPQATSVTSSILSSISLFQCRYSEGAPMTLDELQKCLDKGKNLVGVDPQGKEYVLAKELDYNKVCIPGMK